MSILRLLAIGTVSCLPAGLHAGTDALDPDAWPRTYRVQGAEVAIYMPQVVEWNGYLHLKANAAIGIKSEGAREADFGSCVIEADTVTDFDEQIVRLGGRTFSGFRFPELDAAAAAKAEAAVRSILRPESPLELPLAGVTEALERSGSSASGTAVNFDPPPIFRSESPAALVTFIGTPRLEAVAGDSALMFAVNTNWDVLFDGSRYYLLAGNRWLAAPDLLKGPWTAAASLPESFSKLPDDGNWSEVKSRLFVLPDAGPAPRVFTSDRPAEIIVTEGKPQLAPISGTPLMYVVNTESELFFHPAGKTWYLLVSGRWFSATSTDGPWQAAGDELPDAFAEIPADHPKADVLVSVQGTPEADEAVILASIPQTATVRRSATIRVSYEGEPRFKAVPGAKGVEFALNTSSDVFRIGGAYYCCHQGVWFQSAAASGPWKVCDKVPDAVGTIPPQSPKYHVTHVHIYDSTPETVQVGVTSGYYGAYVARGVVVFGLGMWLAHEMREDDCWHGHYYPAPYWYGYGCGAVYLPGHGYHRRGAWCYGPYGGAGYGAAYNPATGRYVRGAYAYGPYRSAGFRVAYNPWTDTVAGKVSASGPYGSWGRAAVMRDDEWIRAGYRSTPAGTISGIQGSRGGAAVKVDRTAGADGFIGKTPDGDIYVGRDGNLYKRESGGGWQKREKGGWQDAPPANLPAGREGRKTPPPSTREMPPPKRGPANRDAAADKDSTPSQLRRDADARQRSMGGPGADRRRPNRR